MIARYGDTDYGYSEAGYGYGVSAFTGFDGLSIIPDTLGWWSVARRVLNRYNGPAIRLRRSSDSAERDFYGIGPQGEVSTADVRAWNGWNLLSRTEDFGNAFWTQQQVSVSTNQASWRGQAVADLVTVTTDNAIHRLIETSTRTFPAGTQHVVSLFVKYVNAQFLTLVIGGNTADPALENRRAIFDILNGTIVSDTTYAPTAFIHSDGDGWYRIGFTMQGPSASVTNRFGFLILNASQQETYAGNGESVLVAGAQLERGSTASTYEPRTTTGAGDSFLVTLYDQSGLARNFTQSTTTLQPIICEQGVPVTESGRLAAKFVAADARRMSIASSTAMFNALHTTGGSVLWVAKANNTTGVKGILGNRTSTNFAGFDLFRDGNEQVAFGASRQDVAGVATAGNHTTVTTTDLSSTAMRVDALVVDCDNITASERVKVYSSGTLSATTNALTGTPFIENASQNLTLGSNAPGTGTFDGPISEVALFSSLISTADRTTWQSRSGVFYGVTIS